MIHPENDPGSPVVVPDFFEAQFETKRQAIHRAVIYGLSIPALTFLSAGVLMFLSHVLGGPLCTAGSSTWICSRTFEWIMMVCTCTIAFGGMLICAGTVWYKFRNYQFWAPWLACLYGLVPFSLFWATGTIALYH